MRVWVGRMASLLLAAVSAGLGSNSADQGPKGGRAALKSDTRFWDVCYFSVERRGISEKFVRGVYLRHGTTDGHAPGTNACACGQSYLTAKQNKKDARCSPDRGTSLRVDPVEPRHVLRLQLPLGERKVRVLGSGLGLRLGLGLGVGLGLGLGLGWGWG